MSLGEDKTVSRQAAENVENVGLGCASPIHLAESVNTPEAKEGGAV
jgi:hypothetical protein